MPEVTLDQGTVRYRDEGAVDGPVVVFIHGALVDGRLWDPVVERLRGVCRCVVPELPLGSHEVPLRADADLSPHGLAELIAGFLEALELTDVVLVGNDTGGALCQLVVTGRAAPRIGKLVLTPCDAFEDFPPAAFVPLFRAAKLPGVLAALLQPMRIRRVRRLPLAYGWLTRRPVPDAVVDGWVGRALRDPGVMRDLRKALAGIDPSVLLDNTPRLTSFDKPVLIAWAREDRFFKVANAHRLAAVFPDARVEELGDSYTFVSWDQPDRVAALIGAFAGAEAAQLAGSVAA
jgi:pimeloyl-ACP methyl ester carboxylesterase